MSRVRLHGYVYNAGIQEINHNDTFLLKILLLGVNLHHEIHEIEDFKCAFGPLKQGRGVCLSCMKFFLSEGFNSSRIKLQGFGDHLNA